MSNPNLAIVIGSVRPNRFAAHAAEWIEQIVREMKEGPSRSAIRC